jgi:hypothetical protein
MSSGVAGASDRKAAGFAAGTVGNSFARRSQASPAKAAASGSMLTDESHPSAESNHQIKG